MSVLLNSLSPPGDKHGATTVHVFPGQGDFALSPLVRGVRTQPLVRAAVEEVFDEIDAAGAEYGVPPLGRALLSPYPPSGRDLAEGPVGRPQLALFGASVAVHRALSAAGRAPHRVLGVSFGEIAACTAGGILRIADGARAACELARCLAPCAGGMTLLGAGEAEARALLRGCGPHGLALACVNAPDETVLSGPLADLERVEALARGQDLATQRLRLPFLSHHPSLTREADRFAAALRGLPVEPAALPVHSAVLGRAYEPDEDVPRRLAACLTHPVHLPRALRGVVRAPYTQLLEAGTGWSLTRCARRSLPTEPAAAHAPLSDPDFPWNRPRRGKHAARPRSGSVRDAGPYEANTSEADRPAAGPRTASACDASPYEANRLDAEGTTADRPTTDRPAATPRTATPTAPPTPTTRPDGAA
ncbi:acyltransferase domain-containing protein [Streptomyces sp. ODS28]|uniref:ACP S-malonyltransferase n=1 Tax=Streptomyces sp. ODS28 TaxID=3136688 RepID=UPI0031EB3D20